MIIIINVVIIVNVDGDDEIAATVMHNITHKDTEKTVSTKLNTVKPQYFNTENFEEEAKDGNHVQNSGH